MVTLSNAERGVVLVLSEGGTLEAKVWARDNTADLSAVVEVCRGRLTELEFITSEETAFSHRNAL